MNCTNCGHPKDVHHADGQGCSACKLIANGNIVSCYGFSTVVGGDGSTTCTGYGGHKSWCDTAENRAKTDQSWVNHFLREYEDTPAMEAYAVAVQRVQATERRFMCHCCGESFRSSKPPDPERDTGYGTCPRCHEMVAQSWVKHGFPGDRPITMEQAKARLQKHA